MSVSFAASFLIVRHISLCSICKYQRLRKAVCTSTNGISQGSELRVLFKKSFFCEAVGV